MNKFKILLASLLAIFTIFGCDNDSNKPPVCSILSPVENETLLIGDTVMIKANASDEDGKIKEIKLMINGVGKAFVSNSELKYNWIIKDEPTDDFLISIIAIDNENSETNSKVKVKLIDKIGLAALAIDSINNITDSSAIIHSKITNTGNSTISEVGICWSTEENVTINDNKSILASYKESFSIQISELSPITKYYFKAYAINETGIAYSNVLSITTNENFESIQTGSIVDTRDGQNYKTIKIGNNWWFGENLKYNSENSLYYQNDSNSYHKYGKLYSYAEAHQSCPDGWHLASDNEWKDLELAIGMSENEINLEGLRGKDVSKKLKKGGESHFEAELGGYCQEDDCFADFGLGYWWTSTKKDSENIWFRSISDFIEGVGRDAYPDTYYFNVRCVKDE